MKAFVVLLSFILTFTTMPAQNTADPIYQFTVEDLYGETFELASLEGKKVIIVNTASK
ncbi:MAG: glutathione peroxidase, partial [Bacteroidetes bacterium]|nr:glutathione peroxidase [Bacteroidota bacterium]